MRGKRLRAGDSWSKLYAERAFKNQKVTSPKELKHHEQIVKQYVPHELTFRRCGVSLTSARTDTSTSCRLLATKTALLMSLTIPCFPPIISCGQSYIRCAGSAVHTFHVSQLDPDNSIVGMFPERNALKSLVRALL